MRPPLAPRALRCVLALAAAALLAGCASLAPDGGIAPVEQAVRDRLGAELRADRSDADRAHIERRVAELLVAPLSAEAAVQIALLNQRGLQARLAALGVSEAERVQAGRLQNPGFSFSRLRRGDETELERGLHFDLLGLLLLPQRSAMASRQFERDRLDTLQAVLAQALETRKAWVQAVAAEEGVRYMRRVMQAAEASAELARRVEQVGNFSRLQRAREQGFYADAALNLARAEQQQRATREQLIRRFGLWGAQTGFTLPEHLPGLPAEPADQPDIEPGSATPKIMTMLDFNLWSWNSRIFPGIDSLNVRLGDKVRIRVGNLTMTNHPIHLHGHEFAVTGTDGGPTPKGARWPEVTTDVAVGQMRQVEFVANEPGDWAFHCHKSHHTMNAMGHGVPTMIGVDHRQVARQITQLIPDYMVMGERGMADMAEMEMPLPDNTAPMMTGDGPFGSVEMGGMFSVLKVRADQKPGDYGDPGWFAHPPGTVAYEWTGALAEPQRAGAAGGMSMPARQRPPQDVEVQIRKPAGGHGNH